MSLNHSTGSYEGSECWQRSQCTWVETVAETHPKRAVCCRNLHRADSAGVAGIPDQDRVLGRSTGQHLTNSHNGIGANGQLHGRFQRAVLQMMEKLLVRVFICMLDKAGCCQGVTDRGSATQAACAGMGGCVCWSEQLHAPSTCATLSVTLSPSL